MRIPPVVAATALAAVLAAPASSAAHSGEALDSDGCHQDRRSGDYHCHRGPAGGYTFPDRAAMKEAVRTGEYPDRTVDREGFLSRLWPFGDDEDGAGDDEPVVDEAALAKQQRQQEYEERLKTLQGLYEMGLLTREEYEAKRREVLDEL